MLNWASKIFNVCGCTENEHGIEISLNGVRSMLPAF